MISRLHSDEVEQDSPYSDPLYFMAAVLDSFFKFHWIRDLELSAEAENRLKQDIIQLIVEGLNEYSRTSTHELNQAFSSLTISSLTSTPKAKGRKLFDYVDRSMDDHNKSTTLDSTAELNAYLNDPVRSKHSDYWFHSQLKILKRLVIRLFSVQASSAPIERAFLHAGLIMTQRRTNMNEQLFRDLVFLRVNQKLLLIGCFYTVMRTILFRQILL